MIRKAMFVFILCIGFYNFCFAHPPSDIIITYDANSKTVKAVIMHNVSDIKNHHIAKVDVGLNGKEIIEQKIAFQDNNKEQIVVFYVPDVLPNDIISVEGYCSISGKLKKEIKT